jgi:hypothetical protein
MPINPTTLKALIDTQITNETVDFAITPAEVGGRMKDAIDYTTEQVGAKQDTLVSATNIKTINGTSVLGSGNLVISGSSVTKVLKTTITSAQILSLFDTPITVLDSTDPLTIKLPINIWIQRKAGDAYTLAAASFLLVNDIGGNVTGNLNPNPLTGSSVGFFTSAYTITQNSSGSDRNALYKLKASTGNPTGGTGDIDVYVTYIEITL